MVGQRINAWTVLELMPKTHAWKETYYKCQCNCGTIVIQRQDYIKKSKLCKACYNKNQTTIVKTHGYTKKRIYSIWKGIKDRCYNKKSRVYENYGAKGIKMAEHWHDFTKFLEDMGDCDKVGPDVQIHRINPEGNYEPGNCQWVTPEENRRQQTIWERKKKEEKLKANMVIPF